MAFLRAYVGDQGTVGGIVHAKYDEGEEDGGETIGVDAWIVPSLLRLNYIPSTREYTPWS